MATILQNSVIFPENKVAEFSGVAPSPLKDFYHLLITKEKIIWRWWRITSRNDASKLHPGESESSYEDFVHDDRMQLDIVRIFDQGTLDYVLRVVKGDVDFLPRLPKDLLVRIISFIGLEDLSNLANVSSGMAKLCNDQQVWKNLYRSNCPTPVDGAIEELGDLFGWKKLFFTNKLQLQVQLRRVRSGRGDKTADTKDISQGEESDEDF